MSLFVFDIPHRKQKPKKEDKMLHTDCNSGVVIHSSLVAPLYSKYGLNRANKNQRMQLCGDK